MTQIDRLEFGYNHGFTCGLQMVSNLFSKEFFDDMKRHKIRLTPQMFSAIMNLIIDNRELLRDNPKAFIRCNPLVKNKVEVFVGR